MPDFDVVDSYRGGRADDEFDLPRYQPRTAQRDVRPGAFGHITSPTGPRLNPGYPPSNQQLSPYQSPTDNTGGMGAAQSQRQHPSRLSQILDVDVFGGAGSLARSTSLGGMSRVRHGSHPPDDVERAFADLPPNNSRMAPQQQSPPSQSFYNSSITYQNPASTQGDSNRPQSGEQLPYPVRRSTTNSYQDSGYAGSSSTYDAYGGSSEPPRSSHSHASSPPTSSMSPPQSVPLQHSPSLTQSYHPSISAAFSTPPRISEPLPPPSSTLPDTSASLRPYAYSAQQYRSGSASNPATPSYPSRHQSPQVYGYAPRADEVQGGARPMSIDGRPPPAPAQPPPPKGLRRVRGPGELRPRLDVAHTNRRANASGEFLSPLKCLTSNLAQTYNICNPAFRYETAHNPRRVLTKPSKPAHNDGFDNEDYDYILYVNDCLGTEEGQNKYLILDVLGQGTFGQVVKCQNIKTHEIVAVKVVKNKPAYFNQSMMEVTILELLNNTWDPHDEHHILRLRDTFIHKSHLCLVFELLSSNLYELIKQNSFGGLSTQLVKVFTAQLLDSLTILNEAKLIHCDLKPENILLKSLQSPQIKVIDFGSACHERQTVYTYIQSRFYRSPEVLLGLSYNSAIDMWSLGCIAVELFLGLPLFPGTSEYNQITRIVEMMGLPPQFMLDMGKQTGNFFNTYTDEYGRKRYRLKTLEQYSREHGTAEQPGKKYFTANTLPDIIKTAPQPKSATKPADFEKEALNRAAFIDFVQGLLNLNPIERWSPQQARLHPFITGEKFTRPYVPADVLAARASAAQASPPATAPATNPKQPYGGLVPSQPKGTRAYTDAASYNQHLNQHQSYTAQAAVQAAQQPIRNPYVTSQQQQQQHHQQAAVPPPPQGLATHSQPQSYERNDYAPNELSVRGSGQQTHRLQHQLSTGNLTQPSYPPQPQQTSQNYGPSGVANPNPPSTSYYPQSRARANTINQRDQAIPPAIARIASLGMDVSGIKRNTLTPVLNREEAIKEWERRASGQVQPPGPAYPQLEYLQQQAELASTNNWNGTGSSSARRYQPVHASSLHNFQAPPSALTIDSSSSKHHREQSTSGLRDVSMGSLSRPATGYDQPNSHPHANLPPAPPQAYTSNSSSARYANSSQQHQQPQQSTSYQSSSNNIPYDAFDHRDGLGTLYTPMQPSLLSSSTSLQSHFSPGSGGGSNGNNQSTLASAASFYGGGVVPTSQQQPALGLQHQQRQQPPVNPPPQSHQADPWAR